MDWSEDELRAAVKVYVEMRRLAREGHPFVKKSYYERLAGEWGRSVKSYEYRMQNISFVYSLQGRSWVEGLKPARNVGTNVIRSLQRLIAEEEGIIREIDAEFEAEVRQIIDQGQGKVPPGNPSPETRIARVTRFRRDPAVVAWILVNAQGMCECCEKPAPFQKEDGSTFLEVHHLQSLADGGADTIANTLALCPNCHRRLHYGVGKDALATSLRNRIARIYKPR